MVGQESLIQESCSAEPLPRHRGCFAEGKSVAEMPWLGSRKEEALQRSRGCDAEEQSGGRGTVVYCCRRGMALPIFLAIAAARGRR